MDRHRSGASIAVGILVASVLAGCTFARPLPTYDNTFDRGTGFEGFLHVDGDCVWVETENVEVGDKEPLNVMWPAGYRARGQPLEIIDASGAVIARAGDLVLFGIGDMEQVVIPGCPVRRVIVATEIGEVNREPVQRARALPTPFVDRPILR